MCFASLLYQRFNSQLGNVPSVLLSIGSCVELGPPTTRFVTILTESWVLIFCLMIMDHQAILPWQLMLPARFRNLHLKQLLDQSGPTFWWNPGLPVLIGSVWYLVSGKYSLELLYFNKATVFVFSYTCFLFTFWLRSHPTLFYMLSIVIVIPSSTPVLPSCLVQSCAFILLPSCLVFINQPYNGYYPLTLPFCPSCACLSCLYSHS